jgi:hypothetical protein
MGPNMLLGTHLLGALFNDCLFQNIPKIPKDIPFVSLTNLLKILLTHKDVALYYHSRV